MTRIACLLGSPRAGGNSDDLAAVFCDEAEQNGAVVDRFALREMRFRGCINLLHCKTVGHVCGQDDDLRPALETISAADIVVMATPIYFCNVSGLLKQALDRFFSFFVPDYVTSKEPSRLGRDKTIVLLQVQGEGAERYDDLLIQYGPALDKLGFTRRELLRGCGVREIGDARNDLHLMQEARLLARRLMGVSD